MKKISLISFLFGGNFSEKRVSLFPIGQFPGCGFLPYLHINFFVGSTEAPSKAFLLFFLFSDWLKSNRRLFFGHFFAPYL